MSGANTNCPSPDKAAKSISSKIESVIALGCRYVVGGVFLMAAVSKIVNSREFESQVLLHSSLPRMLTRILPSENIHLSFSLTRSIVLILPWLELSCGLCLIFRRAVRESALFTSLLLSSFIVQAIAFRSEDCHCFFFPMVISNLPWWWHPFRDGLLLGCSLFLVFRGLPKEGENEVMPKVMPLNCGANDKGKQPRS